MIDAAYRSRSSICRATMTPLTGALPASRSFTQPMCRASWPRVRSGPLSSLSSKNKEAAILIAGQNIYAPYVGGVLDSASSSRIREQAERPTTNRDLLQVMGNEVAQLCLKTEGDANIDVGFILASAEYRVNYHICGVARHHKANFVA